MTQLRDYRAKAGLTLRDMSELTGFSIRMVNRHELGIYLPNPVQIEKYRKATGGQGTSADWARLQRDKTREREAVDGEPQRKEAV